HGKRPASESSPRFKRVISADIGRLIFHTRSGISPEKITVSFSRVIVGTFPNVRAACSGAIARDKGGVSDRWTSGSVDDGPSTLVSLEVLSIERIVESGVQLSNWKGLFSPQDPSGHSFPAQP